MGRGGLCNDVTSCLTAWSHVPSWKGVSVPGPMFLLEVSVRVKGCLSQEDGRGSLSGEGISIQGSLCQALLECFNEENSIVKKCPCRFLDNRIGDRCCQ